MSRRQQVSWFLGATIEGWLLLLVCLSPWGIGGADPVFSFLLYAATGLLLVLWAGRVLLDGQFAWKKDPVALCLGALVLLGAWQLLPLPGPMLSWLSPATTELFQALLPAEPERLPLGGPPDHSVIAAGSRLSVYPYATHVEIIRLLAVCAVYVLVRNNIASANALRRLSIALVGNGVLLAVFAIVQFLSSPHDTVYWTVKTEGAVFGPFVCRTHFPAYVNLAIGAAIGLLVSRRGQSGAGATALLRDPRQLWLGCALALMVASVALSLSRGGFLALLGAFGIFLVLRPARQRRMKWLGPAVVSAALALGLVAWIGPGRVENRLATIWQGQALQESRLPLWSDAWPLVFKYPWWGTGYGTFGHVEPLHRAHIASRFFSEHAHNEFLEAIIEGGVLRLAITILAIALVLRGGYRAARRYADRPAGGLALGGLFGIVALVIHSAGDFGIHLPAIALAAAVLSAQLVSLGRDAPAPATGSPAQAELRSDGYVFRLRGMAPVLGALTLGTVALTLWGEGLRMVRLQSLQVQARQLATATAPAAIERRLALLETAARLAPNDADVRLEVGEAQEAAFADWQRQFDRGRAAAEASQLVLASAPSFPMAMLPTLLSPVPRSAAWEHSRAMDRRQAVRRHLIPGLRHYLAARDLCPLMFRPQLRIASTANYYHQADPAIAYLGRIKRLRTNDPELWFLAGLLELRAGHKEAAVRSWRRSLKISDKHFFAILDQGKPFLTAQDFVAGVLPDRPELLVTAALRLYPQGNVVAARRPFLHKALVLLKDRPGPRTGGSYLVQAHVHQYLGQNDEALQAYQKAIDREPRELGRRFEYAQLLLALGKKREAQQMLSHILQRDPANAKARALLAAE